MGKILIGGVQKSVSG